ncbi:MBL fold metallo-hydrolase [Qipengyuania qiaonensis]|uniref:MBL fold metallo-hydrolase n=1 Tax=Qipengyuania qiaonensis TaxID=2867240 RepID=A0ABS7J492_9SPHN|nr:MBL fold metallo-hydrolase [Qipengyuania qiaonensis]MBX7482155.1 MBL fold metallo-hydrolase [Qipengyuania qiaonensis]
MHFNPFASSRKGTEILPGVHMLGTRRVNFFVLEEGRSLTLIDCGFDGHRHRLQHWLDARGRRLSDIEAVLLTHGHADHVGFAERLARAGVPVYLHHADVHFACSRHMRRPPERFRRRAWHPRAIGLFGEALFDGVFAQPPLTRPIPIGAGPLDLPGRPAIDVIATPGHTAGHTVFHVPQSNALFTGDALMTADPMFGGPERALVFAERESQTDAAMAALAAFAPYGEAALLPAHGEPWLAEGAVARAVDEAVAV